MPGLADQQFRIGVWFGYELLGAAVLVVAAIQVAARIHRESMDFDVAVGQFPGDHPRVEVIAFEIEFVEAERTEVGDPDAVVINDDVEGE